MPVQLTAEEINAFLDSKPGWMILTTMGRGGYPHTVPIGYFRVGDEILMGCGAGTQKLKNIARNPHVSLLVESGRSMGDIKAVMIQGDATVYTDAADTLRLARAAARLRGLPETEWPTETRDGAAYIGVRPARIISWDYARSL